MSLALLKLVNNSDAGDVDHVGGNDWDQMANTLNTFESGTTISLRRTDGAGNQTLEFGPNHATGGLAAIDFHTNSGDGDYSFRLLKNSTAAGRVDFVQSTTGGFRFQTNSGTVSTVGLTAPFVEITQIITDTDAVAYNYPSLQVATYYRADDITDPFDLGTVGLLTQLYYGVSGADKAAGSAIARNTEVRILGSTHVNNEIAMDMAWMRSDNAQPASIWFTDWSIHGPIAVQPGLLTGVNMFINNYYNGDGTRGAGYNGMFSAQTRPGTGGGADATHIAATTYKMNYGVGVFGFAGTVASPVTGYDIGVKIGGTGGIWLAEASKIAIGCKIADIETTAIDLSDPATSASSPVGIKVTTATRTYDTFIDLSSGLAPTTAAIKLGTRPIIGTTMRQYETGANTWDILAIANTFSLLRLVPNIGTVASTAIRGVMRVQNTASGANDEYLGLTANGTNPYTISASASGGGSVRQLDFLSGATVALSITTTPTLKSSIAFDFESYADYKIISAPSDPSAGYGRLYAKQVDSNNDGLFVKLKINGAVTEIQVA